MSNEPLDLLESIRNQPAALAQVVAHQTGPGRAALEQAADLIRGRGSAVFAAIGASYCASIPCVNLLAESGVAATLVDVSELLHFRAPAYAEGTVFVLVSRSGDTVEVSRLLPVLRARKAVIIGVTNEADSELAREADVVILMDSPRDRAVAVQTYTGTLLTLYLLGVCVAGSEIDSSRGAVDAVLQALKQRTPQWEAASSEWLPFFAAASPLYLLARGASVASALEGALLFHEVAKNTAVGMGAGYFRHGPIEAVDASFRCVVFAPDDATREMNLLLAESIVAQGGSVLVFGPDGESRDRLSYLPMPQVSPLLAPLAEIVPLQYAALRLAESRNIPPGQFRILNTVILSETSF